MRWFSAVLFDNGNTLFDKADKAAAVAVLAGELGVELDAELAREAWRRVKAHKHAIADADLVHGRNRSAEGHRRYYVECYAPLDEFAPGLANLFYERFKTSADSMVPYPDTAATLEALDAADVRVAVVSNTGWNIREGYVRSGLDEYVDAYVLSHEHGLAKPEPGLFELACAELGVAPGHTLMVGNNATADSGAAAIGCTCCLTSAGRAPKACLQRVCARMIPGTAQVASA